MKIEIKNKYLIFPVNTLTTKKILTFKRNCETVYQINIKLDNCNPNFYAYIDVSRFIGQTIDILVSPEMKLEFREADKMDIDNLYHEAMRPQVHFTTKNGWMNDPNGLVYIDGTYHMFYQYNPTEPNWDNMHWGHAESSDLIHWEEKDVALFPDERGTMFSGSAILDDKNLLGKNVGNNKSALLYYTTTEPFCQHMSYSTDNFETIERYIDKPVVPHVKGRNRDPKVVFCDELGCHIMVLYLDEDIYCIFRSNDLINWEEVQRIHLVGDNECPDIFPLYDSEGARKWVIIGAHDKYLVGNFVNGKFVAEQSEISLHYGNSGYAGQSFSNLPNNRIVRMVWDRWRLPAFNFNGQMGIPMEMSLGKYEGCYYLQANPVEEIKGIYKNTKKYRNVSLAIEETFSETLQCTAQLLKFKGESLENGVMTVSIFGRSIGFDFANNKMNIGDCTAPISLTRSGLDITILVDRCSVEVFADGGKIFMSCLNNNTVSDFNIPYLTIRADRKITLENVEINSLDSVWGK